MMGASTNKSANELIDRIESHRIESKNTHTPCMHTHVHVPAVVDLRPLSPATRVSAPLHPMPLVLLVLLVLLPLMLLPTP
jgi:hypothetical protein